MTGALVLSVRSVINSVFMAFCVFDSDVYTTFKGGHRLTFPALNSEELVCVSKSVRVAQDCADLFFFGVKMYVIFTTHYICKYTTQT